MEVSRKGRLRRLKALIVKEFFQMIRDPSSIMISVLLPLILLFIYGYGVSLDLNNLRVGLVMEDTSPDARSFAQSMIDSRYFDVTLSDKRSDFDKDITSGKIRGIVVIPSYFSQFRGRPESEIAPIQVIADGSEPNTASFIQNYVQGAWQSWLQQEAYSSNLRGLSLIQSQPRYWWNEELESRNFLLPGSLAIIMTLIGTLLTALVVAREWERGTMEALMSTPVTITEILIGKLIPYFILGMISMAMCVLITTLYYHVPFRGSIWLLAVVSSCFLFTALSVGLFISSLAKNQFVAAQASIVSSFLPAFILSGFVFEISSMPTPIRALTYVFPPRYFVSSLQTLFLVGDVPKLIIWNLIPMVFIGLVMVTLTGLKTVKRLD